MNTIHNKNAIASDFVLAIQKIKRFCNKCGITVLTILLSLSSFKAMSQDIDTLIFTWDAKAGGYNSLGLYATVNDSFTAYWGNGSMTTYTVPPKFDSQTRIVFINSSRYAEAGNYTVTVVGSPTCKITRTQGATIGGASSPLTTIDVTKCKSMFALGFAKCKVHHVDASRATNPYLEGMSAMSNRLTLTECYNCWHACSISAFTAPQFLELRTLARGDTVDFSADLIFYQDGKFPERTVFEVTNTDKTPLVPNTYTEEDGILTFYKTGNYMIKMTNRNVFSGTGGSLQGYAEVYQEIILPPATDACLFSISVTSETGEKGITPVFHCDTLHYTTEVGYNESYITITAVSSDTLAAVTGDIGIQLLEEGENTFTITVTAEDSITTKVYTLLVTRSDLGIEELKTGNGELKIYPDPTKGQLTIESAELKIERVEILDVLGQCVFTTPNPSKGGESSTSAQFPSKGGAGVVIDVSHLASGAYFVTVYSEGQKITRKFMKE